MTQEQPATEQFSVGMVEELPPGTRQILTIGGRSIGVFNIDGEFYAIQNVCPHMLAPICEGELDGTMLPSSPGELIYGMDGLVIRCVRHGWEFDIRTGETVCGVDRRRLATYQVEVRDGRIFVHLRPRRKLPKGRANQ